VKSNNDGLFVARIRELMHSGFESSKTADFADKNAEKAFLGVNLIAEIHKNGM
jgi:hypothetical protein